MWAKMSNFAPKLYNIRYNVGEIIIKKITRKHDMDIFVKFGNQLYANCPYYTPDLESDLRAYFNPRTNFALSYSTVQPFLAFEDGKPVGRIAAFINKHTNDTWHTQNARFMLFDFVDDERVSKALLDAVELWAKEHGMTGIEGPMSFTDFDKEGMLIEDFNRTSTMSTLYNYEYYPRHMEKNGYEKAVDWVQVRVKVPEKVPERFARIAKIVRDNFHLRVKFMTKDEILHKGYGEKVFQLLNECYAPLFGFTPIDPSQAQNFVNTYLRLVDLRMVPTVENEQGEMIGIAVCMGSLSDALRKTKGRLFPFGWFHLLKAIKWKHSNVAELLLIGVRPDYQGFGVNSLFFDTLIPVFNKLHYTVAETGPQLEDNQRELTQWKLLQPEIVKRRRCYKKNLDKTNIHITQ